LQSERGASLDPVLTSGVGVAGEASAPDKQDPAPAAATTANIAQGMIISMAAPCDMVNRRRMHREQHMQSLNKKQACAAVGEM